MKSLIFSKSFPSATLRGCSESSLTGRSSEPMRLKSSLCRRTVSLLNRFEWIPECKISPFLRTSIFEDSAKRLSIRSNANWSPGVAAPKHFLLKSLFSALNQSTAFRSIVSGHFETTSVGTLLFTLKKGTTFFLIVLGPSKRISDWV